MRFEFILVSILTTAAVIFPACDQIVADPTQESESPPDINAAPIAALGQAENQVQQVETQEINNFVIPPDVETVPIGTLGHVEIRGQGETPMILLPGRCFGWRIWEAFMHRNAERYTMYAVTAAGYGGTAPPEAPEQLEDFENHDWTDGLVAGIVKLIEDEKLDQPIVVGHYTLGDHIALRLGLENSDLIRAVVVVAGEACRPFDPRADDDPKPSVNDQRLSVRKMLTPSYRTMNGEQRLGLLIPLSSICNDEARALELFTEQIESPPYVDYRYFLEYLTTNLALELPSMTVPLLVVEPRMDFEDIFNLLLVRYENRYGEGTELAKQQLEKRLNAEFGSMERAREFLGQDPTWVELRPKMPNLQLEYVLDTQTFVMEDQPEMLDTMIAEFVKGLDDIPTTSPADQAAPPSSASSKNP